MLSFVIFCRKNNIFEINGFECFNTVLHTVFQHVQFRVLESASILVHLLTYLSLSLDLSACDSVYCGWTLPIPYFILPSCYYSKDSLLILTTKLCLIVHDFTKHQMPFFKLHIGVLPFSWEHSLSFLHERRWYPHSYVNTA